MKGAWTQHMKTHEIGHTTLTVDYWEASSLATIQKLKHIRDWLSLTEMRYGC